MGVRTRKVPAPPKTVHEVFCRASEALMNAVKTDKQSIEACSVAARAYYKLKEEFDKPADATGWATILRAFSAAAKRSRPSYGVHSWAMIIIWRWYAYNAP